MTETDNIRNKKFPEWRGLSAVNIAEGFADEFGYGPWGRTAMTLAMETGRDADGTYTEAARCAMRRFSYAGELMANPIAALGSSLYDHDDLTDALGAIGKGGVEQETVDALRESLRDNPFGNREAHFLQRMLYSCMTDALRLASESGQDTVLRRRTISLSSLHDLASRTLRRRNNPLCKQMGDKADAMKALVMSPLPDSDTDTALWSLTPPHDCDNVVPAVLWALHNAERLHRDRIIVAVPAGAALIRTAALLKDVFGDVNVLEHRTELDGDAPQATRGEQLRTANWDCPVIVTSCARLFGSIYSAEASQCRRLHNLCRSIVIIDEIQSLPTGQLAPVTDAISTYARHFNTTFVLAGSFVPVLSEDVPSRANPDITALYGLGEVKEIVPQSLRRETLSECVRFDDSADEETMEEIMDTIRGNDRVLCVVNTRRTAALLYDALKRMGTEGLYHVSGQMCPLHVTGVLDKVRAATAAGGPVRVISSSVVEIRREMTFPVVLRERAGLDNIVRSARLCSAEGNGKGLLHMFTIRDRKPTNDMLARYNACASVLATGGGPFDEGMMEAYFRKLYANAATFDAKDMAAYLHNMFRNRYRTAGKEFALITDIRRHVLIGWRGGAELVRRAASSQTNKKLQLAMLPYTVNLFQSEFNSLVARGVIVQADKDGYVYAVTDMRHYDEDTGLTR